MALRLQGVETNGKDFTGCVCHAFGWLHRLGQAHSHANVKHRKAWEAASGVQVRMSEQLLADAFASLLMAKLRQRIDYLVFGLNDEEHCLGCARGQLRADHRSHSDDTPRVARFKPIRRAMKISSGLCFCCL